MPLFIAVTNSSTSIAKLFSSLEKNFIISEPILFNSCSYSEYAGDKSRVFLGFTVFINDYLWDCW